MPGTCRAYVCVYVFFVYRRSLVVRCRPRFSLVVGHVLVSYAPARPFVFFSPFTLHRWIGRGRRVQWCYFQSFWPGRWFGRSWNGPVCHPVGTSSIFCIYFIPRVQLLDPPYNADMYCTRLITWLFFPIFCMTGIFNCLFFVCLCVCRVLWCSRTLSRITTDRSQPARWTICAD